MIQRARPYPRTASSRTHWSVGTRTDRPIRTNIEGRKKAGWSVLPQLEELYTQGTQGGPMRCLIIITLLFLFFGCQSDEHTEEQLLEIPRDTNDYGVNPTDAYIPIVEPETTIDSHTCNESAPYQPGTKIFTERTEAWGLSQLKVRGGRMSVTDIDGDGLPDLSVRVGGARVDRHFSTSEPQRSFHYLLRNTGNIFEDVTRASGFSAMRNDDSGALGRPAEVVVFADVDNDGDLDAYTGFDSRSPISVEMENGSSVEISERSELLLNDGMGGFSLAPNDHGLNRGTRADMPAGASFIDANLDGFIDLWIAQGGVGVMLQDRLMLGDGTGLFQDITENAGLSTSFLSNSETANAGEVHTTAWSAAACDLNNDGISELLTGAYGRAPNHLWQGVINENTLSYQNKSVSSGFAYDSNMSWQDNQFAACFCQDQPEAEGCDGATRPRIQCSQTKWAHERDRQAFRLGGNTGAVLCADFDNDGWADLMTTEIRHWWAGESSDMSQILLNQKSQDVSFERVPGDTSGILFPHQGNSWDEGIITATWIDFDNDGRKDLYLGATDYHGNRGLLFWNLSTPGAPLFYRLSTQDYFEHNRSNGVVAADFDQDGDTDLVVGHSRRRCADDQSTPCYETQKVRFFENTLAQKGNWLQLKLIGGNHTNRAAIGAVVTLDGEQGRQRYEIGGGYGHYGAQNDPVLQIGLGSACDAVITVSWPDSDRTKVRYRLPANQRFEITQGERPKTLPLSSDLP